MWDICLGLALLSMAISTLLYDTGVLASELWQEVVYLALFGLSIIGLIAGKKLITTPRMGFVKFAPKRKRRINIVRVVLTISALLGLGFFLLAIPMKNNPSFRLSNFFFPAVWAANCIIVFSLMAYFLDYRRLYTIGFLFAITVPIDRLLIDLAGITTLTGPIAFGIPATVIIIMGIMTFIRFLHDYPLPDQNSSPEAIVHGRS